MPKLKMLESYKLGFFMYVYFRHSGFMGSAFCALFYNMIEFFRGAIFVQLKRCLTLN